MRSIALGGAELVERARADFHLGLGVEQPTSPVVRCALVAREQRVGRRTAVDLEPSTPLDAREREQMQPRSRVPFESRL